MADDTASRIKRIDDISAPARTAWFTLLGVLAFVAVTLLSITHADILLDARMIALPLVGVSVPTNLFLLLSPIVLTVLYANLHLYLLKLWQAFRRAPTDAELGPERLLADSVQPWLANDYALTLKQGTTPGDHHRTLLRNLITLFTVWWAPLVVLGWMWYVALLTRDLRVILVILACLVVSALVGLHSWLRAHRWLGQRRGRMVPIAVHAALAALAGFAIAASWETTRSPADDSLVERLPGLPHQLRLDREDLIGGNVQDGLGAAGGLPQDLVRARRPAGGPLRHGAGGHALRDQPGDPRPPRLLPPRARHRRRPAGAALRRLLPRPRRQVRRRLGRGAAREARRPAAARPLGPQPRRRLGRGRQPDRGAARSSSTSPAP